MILQRLGEALSLPVFSACHTIVSGFAKSTRKVCYLVQARSIFFFCGSQPYFGYNIYMGYKQLLFCGSSLCAIKSAARLSVTEH